LIKSRLPCCVRLGKKKMAIVASYFAGETYGLLGPQLAATVIEENTPYDCIVIAVTKDDETSSIIRALGDFFGSQRPIVGFSTLSGRQDLFRFAGELKDDGAITILAGPQSDVDYVGEVDWQIHNHRFKGFSEEFSFALHGPAEQIVDFLKHIDADLSRQTPGLIKYTADGNLLRNPEQPWDNRFLKKVKWDNLFLIEKGALKPLKITAGQVLQQIGCPYAAHGKWIEIDYPVSLSHGSNRKVRLFSKGCSFCDVAVDKGCCGLMDMDTVLAQIRSLPEGDDDRKIPFELINENGCAGLHDVLAETGKRWIMLSQISLTVRADWFIKGEDRLRKALELAKSLDTAIRLVSMGFESFDNTLLKNLNKGATVDTNLRAIELIRRLKEDYPQHWIYSRSDGSIHGFIHPTPWDTEQTWRNIQTVFRDYALPLDIIPDHSIPLIIHHASLLGDWIRQIEEREGKTFKRLGTIIEWW
jgi:hypothetical protein